MNPDRLQALAELARAGLTLSEMAAALGVSRQRIHQQLGKCPEIAAERQARCQVRSHVERSNLKRERGIEWAEKQSRPGAALAQFLREAIAHGWDIEVAPRRRPRVNGVRLAFHRPRSTRASSTLYDGPGCARYYHVRLTRPEWLHVVCLPTGRYIFYLPDSMRTPGSCYIPEGQKHGPQEWPQWSHERQGHHRRRTLKEPQPGMPRRWAA